MEGLLQRIRMEEDLRWVIQRHEAVPDRLAEDLGPLPIIDWAKSGVSDWQKPKPVDLDVSKKEWSPSAPLPKADVVVMTWTIAEWAALDHVFCSYDRELFPDDVKKWDWREPWYDYSRDYCTIQQYMKNVQVTHAGGVPSLSKQVWGEFRMAEAAGLKILLLKSEMHLAQDGTELPLRSLVEYVCAEADPGLVLSIGTAGGVRSDDALGCALVTHKARFYLLKAFKNAAYNGETVESAWKIPTDLVPTAQKLAIQVPGFEILPVSPQYPKGAKIDPDPAKSDIKVVDSPIITTDTFLFGTTKNELDKLGCIVEMDDAVVGRVCKEQGTEFGFVRNVSDPVINGDLPESLQEAWAGYIYQQRGLYSSFNGALASWAVIAGGREEPGS